MKNHISYIIIFLIAWESYAQVTITGEPIPIDKLNSDQGENFLVLNQHGKKMAFTKEGNVGGLSQAYLDSYKLDSTWESPRIFIDLENDEGLFSPIGYDVEGNEYFSEVSFDRGIYSGKVMKFLNTGGVSEVTIPFFKSRSAHQSGCLSQDGMFMIISMESNYTVGVEDLYVIRKKRDGTWRSPVNIGSTVNTSFQEITPFLASDNRTLYFSSNGRGGEGSFDIFYSVRQDDSWRNWSEPVSLGSEINTIGSETSFSFLGEEDMAYYISSQNSDGYGDIMQIGISHSSDSLPPEEKLLEEEPIPSLAETPEETIFKVVDKKTRQVIPSSLIYAGNEIGLPEGIFIIDSILMAQREVEIKSIGYLPRIVALDSTLKVGITEVALESIEIGNTIALNNVLFYQGTSIMLDGSTQELDLVVEMMNDNPRIRILLKGHTDNQGDPVLNIKLSEGRVKSVKRYLTDSGISAYRIRGLGYGGNQPIASNETEETRKLNRRVEFEIIRD